MRKVHCGAKAIVDAGGTQVLINFSRIGPQEGDYDEDLCRPNPYQLLVLTALLNISKTTDGCAAIQAHISDRPYEEDTETPGALFYTTEGPVQAVSDDPRLIAMTQEILKNIKAYQARTTPGPFAAAAAAGITTAPADASDTADTGLLGRSFTST